MASSKEGWLQEEHSNQGFGVCIVAFCKTMSNMEIFGCVEAAGWLSAEVCRPGAAHRHALSGGQSQLPNTHKRWAENSMVGGSMA
ncbi:MAG: hypothetical protein Q4A98_11160, partial [Comamonadaceae bacterium]|nr:hypothetical protein [Comamonadaceae bacterium]